MSFRCLDFENDELLTRGGRARRRGRGSCRGLGSHWDLDPLREDLARTCRTPGGVEGDIHVDVCGLAAVMDGGRDGREAVASRGGSDVRRGIRG